MTRFYTLIGACINIANAAVCPDGDSVCQASLGEESFCLGDLGHCHGVGGSVVPCNCGTLVSSPSIRGFRQSDELEIIYLTIGDEPGRNRTEDSLKTRKLAAQSLLTTRRPSKPMIAIGAATTAKVSNTTTRTTSRAPTTRSTSRTTTSTARATTGAPTTRSTSRITTPTARATTRALVSNTTRAPVTTTRTTTRIPTTVRTTTARASTVPTGSVAKYTDGMFVWAEWPSMWGEPDWVQYYAKLVQFAKTSPLNVNKIILRVLDPIYGTAATTPETKRDLWTVSTNSVVYTEFFSKLPSSVPVFELYPYLMDVYNQERWKSAMNTSRPLEAVFKMCSQWNNLFTAQGLTVRCRGVTVDGEERRGYVTEYPSVSTYKSDYGGLTFGYSTGYTQVGVLGTHDSFVDDFYFQLYDFYVRGIYPAKLVMNTNVTTGDIAGYISLLNTTTWFQQLPYYEHPKARFMWSTQHSGNGDCFYPLGPTNCGAKEDFGAWNISSFISFVNTVRTQFPTKFGNKGHGIFQFSLIPNSWNVTSSN